jgi:hypothetical protein
MVWQKIDDGFGIHRKVTRIPRKQRLEAVGLWLLGLNYSGRNGTDGVLEQVDLEECLAKVALVRQLVTATLWHEPGHECPDCVQPPPSGVVIHDFLVYNPDAASTVEETEGKSQGGKYGNHVRWHEKPGKRIAGCDWCESDIRSVTDRSTDRLGVASSSPGPVPDPDLTDMTHLDPVSAELNARETADDPLWGVIQSRGITNLGRIRRAFAGVLDADATDGEVIDLASVVLDEATGFVKYPEKFIETAMANSRSKIAGYAATVQENSPRRFPPHIAPELVALITERATA